MIAARMLLVALAVSLAGCQLAEPVIRAFIPGDARPMLDATKALILANDQAGMQPYWHPDVDQTSIPGVLDQIAAMVPDGPPSAVTLMGANRRTQTITSIIDTADLTVVYEIRWPDRKFSLEVNLTKLGEGPWQVYRFNIVPIDVAVDGPADIADWGIARMAWFALALSVVGFVLVTLISLYRFKRVKRRILWTLFILAGCFPVFAMDWSTAVLWLESPAIRPTGTGTVLNFFEFKLLGAATSRSSLATPWIVEICVPIGALLFWYRVMRGGPTRRKRRESRPS